MNNAWKDVIEMPIKGRTQKPRKSGITMVIDKGLGLNRLHDLIQSSKEYIDIIKLTFGTSAFHDEAFLKKKYQQQNLILRWGLNVNLGNVPPDDILALEAL
ncbi:MAG: phosphosulfolactate synthase [Acidobacteriota bacterium]